MIDYSNIWRKGRGFNFWSEHVLLSNRRLEDSPDQPQKVLFFTSKNKMHKLREKRQSKCHAVCYETLKDAVVHGNEIKTLGALMNFWGRASQQLFQGYQFLMCQVCPQTQLGTVKINIVKKTGWNYSMLGCLLVCLGELLSIFYQIQHQTFLFQPYSLSTKLENHGTMKLSEVWIWMCFYLSII